MEIQLNKSVASLSKIGKSNNSHIYSQLDSQKQPLGSALKIIVHKEKSVHSSECSHLHNEHSILSELCHPNIINVSKKINNSVILQKNEICCMELELADCDLFDKMSKLYPKVIEPSQMRSIFYQVLRGIQYIHNKNIAHNDIKLENIFMFQDQTIPKLADFGFARNFQPNSFQQKEEWKSRCKMMLAPEIINMIKNSQNEEIQEFDEKKSDIFALGLTIFQALMLRLPFEGKCANSEDKMYQAMYEGRFKDYWNQSEIVGILKFLNKFEDFRKSQFIDLMNKMLATNPNDRPTIQQVINHPWFAKINTKNSCFIM